MSRPPVFFLLDDQNAVSQGYSSREEVRILVGRKDLKYWY